MLTRSKLYKVTKIEKRKRSSVWKSIEKVDIPMALNVSNPRKSRRLSNVKNKDVYDIELSVSPKKENFKKRKGCKVLKRKKKNIAVCSFKSATLTTDKCWQNPLTIPPSQFYKNNINISEDEDLSHNDVGYDASISIVDNDDSCFSLPSVSTFIPKVSSHQSTLYKPTSTPYVPKIYTKVTDEQELQECFGFEESVKQHSLLLSPVERPQALTSLQKSLSNWESDVDQLPCPTRISTRTNLGHLDKIETTHEPLSTFISALPIKPVKCYSAKKKKECSILSEKTKRAKKSVKKKQFSKLSKKTTKSIHKRKPLTEINNIDKEKSMLEDWASDINSHFSEIDELDLVVE